MIEQLILYCYSKLHDLIVIMNNYFQLERSNCKKKVANFQTMCTRWIVQKHSPSGEEYFRSIQSMLCVNGQIGRPKFVTHLSKYIYTWDAHFPLL